MSKEVQNQQQSEEVDLNQLFNAIGNLFSKLFGFIGSIFKAIFSVFIYALKAIVKNFKIIGVSMFLAAALGFTIEKLQPDIYISQMLVKPYFDSKYQLVTNVNYYNALIGEKDYKQLIEIFDINENEAMQIIEFEIKPGPENENDKLIQYDKFLKQLDSVRAQEVDFDEYIENRSIYSGDVFEINVKSFKKDIFRSLENGLKSTFENTYSIKKMEKRDSLIAIDKERIMMSLNKVDSLKTVYLKVLEEESKSKEGSYTTRDGMSFIQEKTRTKEYELLQEEMKLRQELSGLESQKVEEDVYFDTLSSFQDVGAKYSTILQRYTIIFPLLTFLILCFVYLTVKLVKFVNAYEG